MAQVYRLYGSRLRNTPNGVLQTIPYEVKGLTNIDDLTPAYAAGLPSKGQVLTSGAVVQEVDAGDELNNTDRLVTVYASTYGGYAGYRSAAGGFRPIERTIQVTTWKKSTPTNVVVWTPINVFIRRPTLTIVKTSFVSLSIATIESFYAANIGLRYLVAGMWMILKEIRVLNSDSSAVKVETTFYTDGILPSFGIGTANNPGDIVIPALNVLDEYIMNPPYPANTSGAALVDPSITVRPRDTFIAAGSAFPWTL